MSSSVSSDIQALMRDESSAMRASLLRFGAMLAPALLAMTVLASLIIIWEFDRLAEIDRVEASIEQARDLDQAISALQRERGLTNALLRSGGDAFAAKLSAQREETEILVPIAKSALDAGRAAEAQSSSEAIAKLTEQLDALATLRAGVDDRSLDPDEAFAQYTELVTALMGLKTQRLGLSPAEMRTHTQARLLTSLAREHAGRERALGAAAFGDAIQRRSDLDDMLEQAARQAAYLDLVRLHGDAMLAAALDGFDASAENERVATMRAEAQAGADGAPASTTTGEAWFDATTERMAALDAVRAVIDAQLLEIIETRREQLGAKLAWTIALAAAAPLASIAMGLWFMRSTLRSMQLLARSLQRISRGMTDVWVRGAERPDIVGLLARSVVGVVRKGEESTRVHAALSVSKSQIMITNAEARILFVNGSLENSADESMDYFMEVLPDFDPFEMYNHMLELVQVEFASAGQDILSLTQSETVEVGFGDRLFEVSATPVRDPQGGLAGLTVEWREITETRAIERQIEDIIAATRRGDFSQQLDITSSQKFLTDVADGVNAIGRQITTFIADLRVALGALAEGDLTKRVENPYEGELAELAAATNATIERLQDLVMRITENGTAIDTQSTEIRDGATALSGRAEQAASALQQTSTAMTELAESVSETAAFAADARSTATTARGSAEKGGEVVAEAVEAMRRIQESSREIVDILGVIEGIAFQTNLLSLNAAVEAARAGRAGAGFAVVAAEVRALAQRSSDAARDISGLISSSVKNVDDGVRSVEATGAALTEIRASVADSSEKMTSITEAATRQSDRVREIAQTVAMLDESTQANAKIADANAGSSRMMAEKSSELAQLVSYFKALEGASQDAETSDVA